MSKRGEEINSLVCSSNLRVDYITEKDKYFFKREEPAHVFNVIGSGMMALEHIHVTFLEGRASIYGIYDTDVHSIAYTKNLFTKHFPDRELVVYESLEEALYEPKADGLIIATPNYTHIDIVREAVKTGKHILLEKPMVTRLEDAAEIVHIAENYPAVLQIGLQYRYKAIYQEARAEVLEKKVLGPVHGISIVEHRIPFLDKVKQWNKFSQYSGGTLVEKCCHYFDLFNLFAGSRPKSVYATGGQAVNFLDFEYEGKKSDILDHAIVIVEYDNGIKCNFNLCMFSPMFYEEITILGTKGRLHAYEKEDYLPAESPKTHFELLTADHGVSKISTPCYPNSIQNSGHMGGTYFEHKNFIENMEGRETQTATVEEGFWAIVVGIAAETAVKTGEKVYIKDLLSSYADIYEGKGY